MIDPESLRLRIHPDPALRVTCRPIGRADPSIDIIAARMIEIMNEQRGIGLAAPQAGLDLRLFVCDVPADDDPPLPDDPPAGGLGTLVCIDPVLSEPSPERSPFDEGCLSIPGVRGDVVRPEQITLAATGLDGQRFTIRAGGLLARCIQHECDHLDGVLIIDRMTQMSRLKNRRRLRELEHSG